ncbi:MAG TPA: tRNA uracil 4-sulfurtransferase ThiI [Nitrososphaerales archaeon]|nr:tRNA uracil 4-sulfurtransferase ThiI [Nitrososphaerales archaeon]
MEGRPRSPGQSTSIYAIHYSEIALKGRNRPEFVRVLRRNLKRAMATLGETRVESKEGRIILETTGQPHEVEAALSKVFGVAWYARASVVGRDYESIRDAVVDGAKGDEGSFKIDARRSDKTFPTSSMELSKRLGGEVVSVTGRPVDLSRPETTIHIDVLRDRAVVYAAKTKGPGGLPVGTSGRVIHLFSGGIDSPVAAWLLMKRGCRPVYLHFYLAPSPDYALESKVGRIARLLTGYSGRSSLLLLPFAEYQLATSGAPPGVEPSLFRRFMRVTAEQLAGTFGAGALSTGDSLSQAASQTLWNMAVSDAGSSLPVLRPLLGYDKEEIVQLAKRIGTYEPSIEEYRDCCAIITRHPKTRVKRQVIDSLSETFEFPSLAKRCVELGSLASFDHRREQSEVTPLRDIVEERKLRAERAVGRPSVLPNTETESQ